MTTVKYWFRISQVFAQQTIIPLCIVVTTVPGIDVSYCIIIFRFLLFKLLVSPIVQQTSSGEAYFYRLICFYAHYFIIVCHIFKVIVYR